MSVDKYNTQKFSGDVPLRAGDRRYSQDRIRDFWFLYDHAGLLLQDLNYPNFKFIVRGGVVSKGSGDTLNITVGEGYAKFSAYIPGAWASPPVPKVAVDVDMARIVWTAQTNLAIPSATLNGVAKNYIKVKYAEADGNTRTRAKAAGTYSYEVTPSFTITCDTNAPTDYEVVLATLIGTAGGAFAFSTNERSPGLNLFGEGTEISSDITLAVNRKYVINATAKLNLTLPATASVGDKIVIEDKGYYGFKIVQNSGQWILVQGKRTVPGSVSFGGFSVKGGLSSITIECITTDTTWQVSQIQDIPWQMKGYHMGGSAYTSVIEDMDFTSETSIVIAATLDTAKSYGTGVSGFGKGYCMGGFNGSTTNVIEDLNFAIESSDVITATLDAAKYWGAGVSGFSKGYCMGGNTGSNTAVIEDLNFATESSAAMTATLDTAKYWGAGVSGFSKGYHMGGYTIVVVNVIEDLNFATESSAAITATLDTAKGAGVGVSGFSKGYCMGGYTTVSVNVIEDLNFATESSDVIAETLNTAKYSGAGVSGFSKGYCMGGYTTTSVNVIEDMNFAVESSVVISATLNTVRNGGAGVQGYIGA